MRQNHLGFTLIELVIASALAALLMMGVLAVLTGITRDRQRLAAIRFSDTPPKDALLDVLRRDLASCTEFVHLPDGAVQLRSCAAIDDKTLRLRDRPCLVTYRIEAGNGLGLLVRDQETQDEPVQPLRLRLLLACHVRQFDLQRLRDATDPPSNAQVQATTDPKAERKIPSRVRLNIAYTDTRDVIDQVLCLR